MFTRLIEIHKEKNGKSKSPSASQWLLDAFCIFLYFGSKMVQGDFKQNKHHPECGSKAVVGYLLEILTTLNSLSQSLSGSAAGSSQPTSSHCPYGWANFWKALERRRGSRFKICKNDRIHKDVWLNKWADVIDCYSISDTFTVLLRMQLPEQLNQSCSCRFCRFDCTKTLTIVYIGPEANSKNIINN